MQLLRINFCSSFASHKSNSISSTPVDWSFVQPTLLNFICYHSLWPANHPVNSQWSYPLNWFILNAKIDWELTWFVSTSQSTIELKPTACPCSYSSYSWMLWGFFTPSWVVWGTSLETTFHYLIPKQQVTYSCANNNVLATIITKLLTPFKMLREHIVSQFEAENHKKLQLCLILTSRRVIDNPIIDLLNQSHHIFKDIRKEVSTKQSTPTENTTCKPVRLSSAQGEHLFDLSRVPVQVPNMYKLCPICGHQSTNIPIKNNEIV